MQFGIRANVRQVIQQLVQVLLVGMTLGMMRNVVPALAESDFGLQRGSFMLLVAFVVAFGFVKGAMNLVAGRLAETMGRRIVLLLGWLIAVPIPLLVYVAPSWNWIVAATLLLGVNQGLTWSMTQTAALDLTRPDQRGVVIGLNEFFGYVGVALASVVTGYVAALLGPRLGLLWFGGLVIGLATLLAWLAITETLPWARTETRNAAAPAAGAPRPRYPQGVSSEPGTREMFALMSWGDRRMAALSQAGLVEKFVDALAWVFWPVYLHKHGVGLTGIGWIVAVYGFCWGAAQYFTGRASDRLGRQRLNVWGMWICGAGVALFPLGRSPGWWSLSAAVTGLGMAMLYPNLSAAVADIAHPHWRASAIGIYRFWRDLGYGVGALALGAAATLGGGLEAAFWMVAAAMAVSGGVLQVWGEETHPRLNPAR
ncbi:MAG: MFS transporter [Ramlibacter sp.]